MGLPQDWSEGENAEGLSQKEVLELRKSIEAGKVICANQGHIVTWYARIIQIKMLAGKEHQPPTRYNSWAVEYCLLGGTQESFALLVEGGVIPASITVETVYSCDKEEVFSPQSPWKFSVWGEPEGRCGCMTVTLHL